MTTAKNILIIPGMIPYPPDDGGRLCTFMLIDYLRKCNNIQVLLVACSLNHKTNIDILKTLWPEVVIHYVEDPKLTIPLSNIKKTINVIKNIIRPLYKLLKGKKSVVTTKHHSEYEPFRSVPFFPHQSALVEKLETIIATNKFDILQTETIEFINLVNIFPPDIKKVFVQIEARGDILYDYGISHNLNSTYIKHVAGNASFIEYAYMSKYDAILALNDADRIKIQQNVSSQVKVYTSPFGLLDKDLNTPDLDNFIPEHLIFIGGENHYPNFDALNWFLFDVMENFTKKPFKKIYVSGKWTEATQNRYKELTDCVEFIGFVDDLAPYLKNSVSIVPIRIGGGGIRTKILLSMAHGSPVVSTTLAAIGITGNNQQELLITDEAADFANAVNMLFYNVQFTRKMAKSAYDMVAEKYSQSFVGAIRNKIYQTITSDVTN
jgi:glycosyltransferase involved in cell wall biosynthesis